MGHGNGFINLGQVSANFYTTRQLHAKKLTFFFLSATDGPSHTHTSHDARATPSVHSGTYRSHTPHRPSPTGGPWAPPASWVCTSLSRPSNTACFPAICMNGNVPKHTRCLSAHPFKHYGFTLMVRKKTHSLAQRQFFSRTMPLRSPSPSLPPFAAWVMQSFGHFFPVCASSGFTSQPSTSAYSQITLR